MTCRCGADASLPRLRVLCVPGSALEKRFVSEIPAGEGVDEFGDRRYTGFKAPAQCAGRRRRENGVAATPPGKSGGLFFSAPRLLHDPNPLSFDAEPALT